jgi:HD-GYP domain-containing protein (c-di-GMP phosphodiesterase class II)
LDGGTGRLESLLADAAETLQRARAAGGGQVGRPTRTPAAEPGSGAVGALALALGERDPATAEHAERVVALTGAVARRLGFVGEDIERIVTAALLHDLGKLAVPDAILHGCGPLSDEDRHIVHRHPLAAERILRALPGMGPVARMVRHAHERFDGTGYPDALRGEEIPLGSRIVQACDAYDAMSSERPFREALAPEEAAAELRAGAGTQFDPRVVDALLGWLADCTPADYAATRAAA